MAESSLRAPDLGAQLRASSCLGKCRKSSLDAGRRQPFSGKSFYLDLPAGRNLQFLTGAIQQLGGVIEGFLSKEVSYIVSSRREAKAESGATSRRGGTSPGGVAVEAPSRAGPPASRTRPPQKPADSVPMSRGKELLQKAIRNQGSSSSILTNARSWGVRILRVDEMMAHVQQPSLESLRLKKRGPEKPEGTCPAESRTRRVASLKAPFLKIEDESRKFRPFHHQFKSFPEISFLGPKDASPFEALTTPGSSHRTREPKSQEADRWPATRAARRRRKGYCECCREAFVELHRHLQSAQHQGFAREAHPYAEVDRIIAQLSHSLLDIAFQPGLPRQPGSPALHGDLLCPETLSASQPACGGATSPRTREEDDHQAPGSPEQDGAVGGKKAPADCAGAGAGPGPAASGRDLGASADTTVDSPGTLVSRSLPTSCGFADLSSGPGPVLVGHKRKVQFPGGNAKKRPGVSWPRASFFAPRALSPCDTWTTDGRQPFSLPLPGQESSPLTSILPLCPPQTSLSLPDPFPWQHTDRLAELWATPAPWPGGGYSPGSEDSECAAPSPVSRQTDQPPSCSAAAGQLAAHLHSAACTEPPGGPAESQATSLPSALPACGEASLSQPPASPSPSTSSKLFSSITQGMKLFSGPELLAGGPGVQIRVMPRRVLHAQQGQNRDTEEAQRPRASPAEPEGAWGQAFEVQVNSCDRGQALGWTDLVFPPTRLQVRPRECGLRDHPLLPQPPAEFLTGQGSVMDSSSHGQLPTCQEAEASLA